MSFVLAVKTLSMLCLYFMGLSIFNPWKDAGLLMVVTMLLCAFATGIGARFQEKKTIRILVALLPFLSFLLAQSSIQVIFLVPPIIYTGMYLVTGKWNTEYLTYKAFFQVSGILCILFLLVCMAGMTGFNTTIVLGTMYLVLGTFVLRQFRMGPGTGPKGKWMDLASLFLLTLAGAAIAGICYLLLTKGASGLIYIFYPFGYLFALIVRLVTKLSNVLHVRESVYPETVPSTEQETETEFTYHTVTQEAPPDAPPDISGLISLIVGILSVVVVAYLFYRLWKWLHTQETEGVEGEIHYEEIEGTIKQEKRSLFRSNRQKIRHIYLQYLVYLNVHGIFRKRSDSSEDVLRMTKEHLASENGKAAIAERLREIYILARYEEKNKIDDTMVQEAKELLKAIKS